MLHPELFCIMIHDNIYIGLSGYYVFERMKWAWLQTVIFLAPVAPVSTRSLQNKYSIQLTLADPVHVVTECVISVMHVLIPPRAKIIIGRNTHKHTQTHTQTNTQTNTHKHTRIHTHLRTYSYHRN